MGSMGSLAYLFAGEEPLDLDIQYLANRMVRLEISDSGLILAFIEAQSSLLEQICGRQFEDGALVKLQELVLQGEGGQGSINSDGILRFDGRLYVSRVGDFIQLILHEAHDYRYSIHPGTVNMYRDLRQHYWCDGMKRDIVEYVSHCLSCQQFKVEHQWPGGVFQRLPIPEWKWEWITIDFVMGLPRTSRAIQPVFHISMLHRYIPDESHVLHYDSLELDDLLIFLEEPVVILARDIRQLCSKSIPMIKIKRRNSLIKEATWETEQEMWEQFSNLFLPPVALSQFRLVLGVDF
ncbi:uncharacterized protein LOC129883572 [Solanum dulcamara]|uniref:uncharacterized protein LOC129883572 n=1 Tax=Solanum dulcamara TaxID=45834 RepID=UPI0024866871|nr:uncharacterized protein LOC129883572 [Solanum dulcamara]